MCNALFLEGVQIKQEEGAKINGSILLQPSPTSLIGERIKGDIFLSGWVQEEKKSEWMSRGPWMPVEIFADAYVVRGKVYEVPKGKVIRGLALATREELVIRILTRKAEGLEVGKLKGKPRWTSLGPRRLIPETFRDPKVLVRCRQQI